MRAHSTSHRSFAIGDEAPAGRIGRLFALGAAITVAATAIVALLIGSSLAGNGLARAAWVSAMGITIVAYVIGTVFFRRSMSAPSRRMERWMTTGSRKSRRSAATSGVPAAEHDASTISIDLNDVTADAETTEESPVASEALDAVPANR